jgi:hypothetical protein
MKTDKQKTIVRQRVVYELDVDTVRYRTRLAHYCVHAKSLFGRVSIAPLLVPH